MQRFADTRILVTGGGSGIGRATVVRLVSEGARVIAADLSAEGLAGTAEASGAADRVSGLLVDVRDEAAVIQTVQQAVEMHGGLDVLINCAGIHRTTPIARLSVQDLRDHFDINLIGTALFCREALPHLPDGSGVIVNVASSSASTGNPMMSAYAASKGAVVSFTKTLAAEVIGRGIRAVAVSPGLTDTPLTQSVDVAELDFGYYSRIMAPLGAATPEQMAGTVAFAASPDAAFITGVEIRADGGAQI